MGGEAASLTWTPRLVGLLVQPGGVWLLGGGAAVTAGGRLLLGPEVHAGAGTTLPCTLKQSLGLAPSLPLLSLQCNSRHPGSRS